MYVNISLILLPGEENGILWHVPHPEYWQLPTTWAGSASAKATYQQNKNGGGSESILPLERQWSGVLYIYSVSLVIGRFDMRKHQNADLYMCVASRLQDGRCHGCNMMLAMSHSGLMFLRFKNCCSLHSKKISTVEAPALIRRSDQKLGYLTTSREGVLIYRITNVLDFECNTAFIPILYSST